MMSISTFSQEILTSSSPFIKTNSIFSNDCAVLPGNGFFPISYSESSINFYEKDTVRSRKWLYRKLFQEHFFQRVNNDFILALDPLLNLSVGKEVLQETPEKLFQNTRGIQAMGQWQKYVSFYTAFFENQARFVPYQSDYFTQRGENYPNTDDTYYSMNATIPGGGRTKSFKESAFDYASAVSYIRLIPIKQLSIQFGNLPRFFGWGYRSMLLSDNSFNYSHLAIDWKISKKWSYSLIRGKQLNLFRKKYSTFVERPYERKGIGIHYLEFKPVSSLSFGLFESTIYLRDYADGFQRVNPYFYNPIITLNSIVNSSETKDLKNLLGINIAWKPHDQHLLYTQLVTDNWQNKNEYGFQIGYRLGNPFHLKNLFLQIEWNQASNYLYAAQNKRISYSHFNLPLAHTLGNGFKELIIRGDLLIKRFFLSGAIISYQANQPMDNKTAFFQSLGSVDETSFNHTTIMNGNFEWGFEFNPVTKLQFFMGANYRTSAIENIDNIHYGAVFFGIRTALTHSYFDF